MGQAGSVVLGKTLKLIGPAYHHFKIQAAKYPLLFSTLQKLRQKIDIQYPESATAHRYLDGLFGIEIGASAYNRFGLDTININCDARAENSSMRMGEAKLSRTPITTHLAALGDRLPFADDSLDFVLTSHVIEHFYDPIAALKEWHRVVRPGGYIFTIAPHKERTDDKPKPRTTLAELIARHASGKPNAPSEDHHSFWITEDFLELCHYLGYKVVEYQDTDDKVGNGFTVVIQK